MDPLTHYNAFLELIESNKGIIFKITRSFCGDGADGQDLSQEIIIKLWQSFASYRPEARSSTWIYRIALNTAISYYRKEKTRRKINMPMEEPLFQLPGPAETNTSDNQSSSLQRFLKELKAMDRALMLLYLEEKSHKEIARIMGISTTNVATKIGRIKLILKEKFSNSIN